MNGPIQEGDEVLIETPTESGLFTVRSIGAREILISALGRNEIYRLIPINGQWQLQELNQPHRVSFIPSRLHLTGIDEIDMLVLLELDYRSLLNACQTNRQLNRICSADYFWRRKVEGDFGTEALQHKPVNETYRQQYEYLFRANDPNREAGLGRVDALIVIERRGRRIGPNGLRAALYHERLNVLQWLEPRGIIQWISNNFSGTIMVDHLAGDGHLRSLQWMADRGILPDRTGAELALQHNHSHVVKWLASKGILPDNPEAAAENGNLDILQFLARRGVPMSVDVANAAATNGHFHILNWLESMGILPDVNGANEAILNAGGIKSLNWLEQRGILPNIDGANDAAGLNDSGAPGDVETLNWLEQRGILPDVRGANAAAREGDVNILNWLEQRRILPDVRGANAAAKNGDQETLAWLAERRIFPSLNIV